MSKGTREISDRHSIALMASAFKNHLSVSEGYPLRLVHMFKEAVKINVKQNVFLTTV